MPQNGQGSGAVLATPVRPQYAGADHLQQTIVRARSPGSDQMKNLAIMLVLMTAPWLLGRLFAVVQDREFNGRGLGAIGAGLLFVFTGIGHFVITQSMAQMLPAWVPARIALVHLTGILEFAVAAGFFVPRFRRLSGWVAAVLLVVFFPANIYAALNRVPLGGHVWGPTYLLVRAPVQAMILAWIYWFTIRSPAESREACVPDDHRPSH